MGGKRDLHLNCQVHLYFTTLLQVLVNLNY